ncbi:hypothetical protein Cflav_PD3203 [Pedosphaera parvula Ellin514]|uniref:Uncharacterized protein n=2 Tax=Pedosphaera TaxID=1032526 RepID=B9XJA6_PEDPL|nr:hypothetical protein Cflav_PD3203 [Pedosphaera parvula Ellin514]
MPFSPPSGIAFHTADQIPVGELSAILRRITTFLQSLDLAPQPLRLYHDWWQHDGLHFDEGQITFHDLFAMFETPRTLFEATPDDDEVFIGVAPEDGNWYLRFRAEWDADDRSIVGEFAIILPSETAALFRAEVATPSKHVLVEESSESYYKSVKV